MCKKLTLNEVGMMCITNLIDAGFMVEIHPINAGMYLVSVERENLGSEQPLWKTAHETDLNYALMKAEYLAVGINFHMGKLKGSDGFTEEQRGEKGKEYIKKYGKWNYGIPVSEQIAEGWTQNLCKKCGNIFTIGGPMSGLKNVYCQDCIDKEVSDVPPIADQSSAPSS